MDVMEATIERDKVLQIDEPRGKADQEAYTNGRNFRLARVGKFGVPVRIRVRAYNVQTGHGGNDATLVLKYNGENFGQQTDRNFDRTNLQVLNHMILDAGEIADFAIETGGHGATEKYVGFEFWLSLA